MKLCLLLIWPLLLFAHQLKAQNDSLAEQTKMLSIICRDFKVSPKEGAIIVNTIQYNRDKLLETLRNKFLSTQQRNTAMAKLMAERQEHIKKVLTPKQQQRLADLELQQTLKNKARLDSLNRTRKTSR
jgi:hypothetical protein